MKLNESFLTFRNEGCTDDLRVGINVKSSLSMDVMLANAAVNSRRVIPWVEDVEEAHDGIALVVGRGPSLEDTWPQILADQQAGAEVFACNAAAQFLVERGVRVDYQVFLDPLPESAVEFCTAADVHLLASIVDPSLFDLAKRPLLWQPLIAGIEDVLPASRKFTGIGGGITVLNCTLSLTHTFGFRDIRVHGADSSYRNGERYSCGPAPHGQLMLKVEHNGLSYDTNFDLKMQVIVFLKLAELLRAAGCTLQVFGDGLLPDVVNAKSPETIA